MTFSEFVEAVDELVKELGSSVVQRRESAPPGSSWWLTFSRAGCLYRLRFDSSASVLTLEREQGSFVPNSPSTWRFLESRQPVTPSMDEALEPVRELLQRFTPAGR